MNGKKLSQCGVFAALLCICAWFSLPLFGVPVTLQSFAIALALLTLGGKWGFVSVLVYLCLGVLGLPVFSGFMGGIGVLVGPTGGYLWGFLLGALVFWGITAWLGDGKRLFALLLLQLICYLCGTLWFSVQFAHGQGLWEIVAASVLPFLLPDLGKLALAWFLANRLRRHID